MRQSPGALIEILCLIAIAIAIAVSGRALLAQLHLFAPAAVVMLGIAILGMVAAIRRIDRTSESSRLELTRRVAYLAGLTLALWAVIAPARWVIGSTIAAAEVAIAFDLFARLGSRTGAPAQEGRPPA